MQIWNFALHLTAHPSPRSVRWRPCLGFPLEMDDLGHDGIVWTRVSLIALSLIALQRLPLMLGEDQLLGSEYAILHLREKMSDKKLRRVSRGAW
jgi:hypothetical protein